MFSAFQKMRSTIVMLLSLLIFRNDAASAVNQASTVESKQCAPGETKCQRIAQEPENFDAMVSTLDEFTDVPWIDVESGLMRLDPGWSLYTNRVHCWPSVGGFIIADRVHSVELDYIGLDRFHTTPRSSNVSDEDAFCRKLRKIGGKWWESYNEYDMTNFAQMKMMWPDEREILFLGWPDEGGVWVLRFDNKRLLTGNLGLIWNALSMTERCEALKELGGVYFKNPEDSEFVAPLLRGFGEKKHRRDPEEADGGWWDRDEL